MQLLIYKVYGFNQIFQQTPKTTTTALSANIKKTHITPPKTLYSQEEVYSQSPFWLVWLRNA
jgi:hypothetical protein